ncbi:hypothetical protein [Anaeromyxobacter diazotrophicus]|uniref:Uncharacterized protein n=1 Tax=Anaeromyxobacter diazotrophicus TaxID=2590199 RepID=A0A7I9VLJ7_9BACT|nr:hypothetical protein [Anaeromyxobacter diazotrophicus]GEJ57068.1 hypothetical protein AMYX_18090 [Anaeromyxobacter diazotrophicus]
MTSTTVLLLALVATAPPRGGAPARPAPTASSGAAVLRAKRAFRTALDLCAPPGRCEAGTKAADPEYVNLLKESEKKFMDACQACAPAEKCDAEAQRLREGKRSPGAAPCE